MRILITTFAWKPHFLPIVPLAWAARLAGHEVRVAASPTLTAAIGESGLPAVPIGGDPRDAFAKTAVKFEPPNAARKAEPAAPEPWPLDWPGRPECLTDEQRAHFRRTSQWSSIMAEDQLEDLLAFAKSWRPDVVLHDSTQFAGPVVASALGRPNVRYLMGHNGYQRVDTAYTREPTEDYLRLFDLVGAEPRIEPATWLDPCPPRLQFPYPHGENAKIERIAYVPYNGPGVVPEWVDTEPSRPRVCLTWGLTDTELSGSAMLDEYRQTIESIRGLDVEVVLAVSPALRDLLGELPAGVRAAVGVPLHAVLAHCGAIVHHGGAGTTMTAAALGVPQLITTNFPNNIALAARLEDAGAARYRHADEVPAGAEGADLTKAEVGELLEPRYAKAAALLAQHVAEQPSPAEVVSRLEELG
ncbi:glycosyltransferase [Amycolatopsis xylanica]|uniref:Glycosyltransferase n=1 Tax=Amycolatopsis xylanica TaxID=589385 RepID=A0A1H2VS19_9PSEU|nr:nucleotide disphospho-sugar-binding domain-containing protein [Amycolatopsis xylanica]SDW71068.1 glycosyltransferase [Amycolatopsis xylanica]